LDKYLSEISIASNEGLAKCKSAAEIWGAIEVSNLFHSEYRYCCCDRLLHLF
jgi:hypothetical protein